MMCELLLFLYSVKAVLKVSLTFYTIFGGFFFLSTEKTWKVHCKSGKAGKGRKCT